MPPPKCCGTCGHSVKSSMYLCSPFLLCDAPIPEPLSVFPRNMTVLPSMGTNCPCWKPKEGEDANRR